MVLRRDEPALLSASMQAAVTAWVNTQQYRNLNPNGLVPTIEEDGFVLYESNAIVRYLAAKHGAGTLWPRTSTSAPKPTSGWTGRTRRSGRPFGRCSGTWCAHTRPDQARRASDGGIQVEDRPKILGYLDAHLKNRAYIVGDALTMGDIPIGCAIWRWMGLPIETHRSAQRAALVRQPVQPPRPTRKW